jgi:hypothetical protein
MDISSADRRTQHIQHFYVIESCNSGSFWGSWP